MKSTVLVLGLGLLFVAFAFKSNDNALVLKKELNGISFSGISFEDAKTKAIENNQLIFVDAYTTWCGPCKQMAATSFKDEEVAELFNEKFINLKIDCEEQNEGVQFAKDYKVRAYPTLLIINGEGTVVKRVVGYHSASELINLANSVD
jgi:thiol:disulfide interchange protein